MCPYSRALEDARKETPTPRETVKLTRLIRARQATNLEVKERVKERAEKGRRKGEGEETG